MAQKTRMTDSQAMDRLAQEWQARDTEEGFNGGDAVDLLGQVLEATGRAGVAPTRTIGKKEVLTFPYDPVVSGRMRNQPWFSSDIVGNDVEEARHEQAALDGWRNLPERDDVFVPRDYVVACLTLALLQRAMGARLYCSVVEIFDKDQAWGTDREVQVIDYTNLKVGYFDPERDIFVVTSKGGSTTFPLRISMVTRIGVTPA